MVKARSCVAALFALLALILLPSQGRAQNNVVVCSQLASGGCLPLPSTGVAFAAKTVGVSHGSVLAANTATVYLMLHNPSAAGGNTIYCSFGGTATVAGAGTLSLAPGQYLTFEANSLSQLAVDCIATGASTPMTIGTN